VRVFSPVFWYCVLVADSASSFYDTKINKCSKQRMPIGKNFIPIQALNQDFCRWLPLFLPIKVPKYVPKRVAQTL
jgi:hypothetical protein